MMGGTNDILSGIRVTHLEKMMLSEINKLNKKIPLCIGIPPLMTPLSITTGWQTHFAFTKNNKDLKNYGSFLKANCIDLDILFIDFQLPSLLIMPGIPMVSIPMKRIFQICGNRCPLYVHIIDLPLSYFPMQKPPGDLIRTKRLVYIYCSIL